MWYNARATTMATHSIRKWKRVTHTHAVHEEYMSFIESNEHQNDIADLYGISRTVLSYYSHSFYDFYIYMLCTLCVFDVVQCVRIMAIRILNGTHISRLIFSGGNHYLLPRHLYDLLSLSPFLAILPAVNMCVPGTVCQWTKEANVCFIFIYFGELYIQYFFFAFVFMRFHRSIFFMFVFILPYFFQIFTSAVTDVIVVIALRDVILLFFCVPCTCHEFA